MGTTTFSGPIRAGTVREGASANAGNVVLSQTATVAYTDDGSAVSIATVPANSQILEIYVDVTTAFNGGTTDLLDIGKAGDADHFANDLDVSAVARLLGTSDVSQITNYQDVGTSDVTVTATYTDTAGDASAGAARVTVVYVQNAS